MLTYQQLQPVAEISRPKGPLRHRGLLLADGRVAHCSPARGEHISSAEDFAAGEDVIIDRQLADTNVVHAAQRIAEALRSPKAYDVVQNNCETFVNRVLGRKAESPQLQGIVILLGVAAFLGFAAAR